MHVTEFEDKESICKVSIAMCYMINVIYKIVLLNSPNIPDVTQSLLFLCGLKTINIFIICILLRLYIFFS